MSVVNNQYCLYLKTRKFPKPSPLLQEGSDSPGWSPRNYGTPLGKSQSPKADTPNYKSYYENQRTPTTPNNYNNKVNIFLFCYFIIPNLAGIYLIKVNNRNTKTRCEICSKFTRKTPERGQLRRSGVFVANFEHISRLILVFLLLNMNV